MVWTIPVSLATTQGISIDFFSSAYLDVSVQRVDFLSDNIGSLYWVAPFGDLRVVRSFATNRSLSQLTTSFIVSNSLGIHHALLFAFKSL